MTLVKQYKKPHPPKQQHYRQVFWRYFISMMASFVLCFTLAESITRGLVYFAQPSISGSKMLDHKFYLWQQAAKKVEKEPKQLVIFSGDSYTNMAIYPELINAELAEKGFNNITTFNAGIPGASPNLNLSLLQYMVAHYKKPNAIIFNVSNAVFNQQQHWSLDNLFNTSYLKRCVVSPTQPSLNNLCPLEKHSLFLRFTGFWHTQLSDLFNIIFSAPKQINQNPWGNKPHVYTETSDLGWAPGYKLFHDKTVLANPLNDEVWTAKHIEPFIKFCQQQNIPLVLIWLPNTPNPKLEVLEQLAPIKKLLDTYPNTVRFLDLQHTVADNKNYYDNAHLNAKGAIIASTLITQKLTEQPFKYLLNSGNYP